MVKNYFNNYKSPMLVSQQPQTYLAHDVENTPNRVKVLNQPHSPLALESAPSRRRETPEHRRMVESARRERMKKFIQERQDKRDAKSKIALAENQRKVKALQQKRKAQADRYEKASFFGLNPAERKIVMGAAVLGAVVLTGGMAAGALEVGVAAAGATDTLGGLAASELAATETAISASVADTAALPFVEVSSLEDIGAIEPALAQEESVGLDVIEEDLVGDVDLDAPNDPLPPIEEEISGNPLNEEINPNLEEPDFTANQLEQDALDRQIADLSNPVNQIGQSSLSVEENLAVQSIESDIQAGNSVAAASRITQLAQQGARGLKVISSITTPIAQLTGLGLGIGSIIASAKQIKTEQTISGKISRIGEIVDTANKIAEQSGAGEIEELKQINKDISIIHTGLKVVEEAGDRTNEILEKQTELQHKELGQGQHLINIGNQELQADKTHNQQLKEIIKDNRAQTQAVQHSQLVLDNELQNLESEEKKEEDIQQRVATTLDRPTSPADFTKDLQGFNSNKSKVDYIVENYSTFILFNTESINNILDMLNDDSVLNIA